jgi:acetate kinase
VKVLVLNCGSSSLKWKIVDTDGGVLRAGKSERLGEGLTHEQALDPAVRAAKELGVEAVGHRVVHGGARFDAPSLITDEAIAQIEACVPLAPIHNPPNLLGIRAARRALGEIPQVAVFDTAFHSTLPRRARTYALPRALAEEHGFRRYGFHGISHAYVARLAAEHLRAPLDRMRLVTCHLGNGASVAAVEFGRSIETSMGLTPLEGLVMGTRSGDLDPAIVLALLRDGSRSVEEVERLLNLESGLAGLSGLGNDLRDIEEAAARGDDAARLAIEVFAHRVRKYIGSYAAVMGGVDAVVLTGGIGENAAAMRRRILQRFEFLGMVLDEDANASARVSREAPVAEVSAPHARVRALVVATDEERMIALETAQLVERPALPAAPRAIPIAVSARHVHLDRDAMDALFGPGSELTPKSPLSQPGQFAAEEKVSLVGPRARIDGVRVLGPVRKRTQVEISRTDEFTLGVDAPVRPSGQVEASAPIVLEGPAGTVQLSEGLICALRHIHMHPDDAAAFGVKDHDVVEVAVRGGARELTFGNVQVRVSDAYRLEMHIDTDEANAAEIDADSEGALVYTPAPSRVHAGLVRKH